MSENQLIPVDDAVQLPAHYDEDAWREVVASYDFLPYIQLCSSSSKLAKSGKIGINRYALVKRKDDFKDLGTEVNIVPICYRFRAMHTDGEGEVVNSFDHTSELFKKIKEESFENDSGSMFGPEFMIWIPDTGEFAAHFLNSKSARNIAAEYKALVNRGATLKSKLVSSKKYEWQVPVIVPCSAELSIPELSEMKEMAEKFLNPKVEEPEADTSSEDGRER